MKTFVSTLVYPADPKWCGGPCTWRVRARTAEEAEAIVARLTSENGKPARGRWREDGRASPFRSERRSDPPSLERSARVEEDLDTDGKQEGQDRVEPARLGEPVCGFSGLASAPRSGRPGDPSAARSGGDPERSSGRNS